MAGGPRFPWNRVWTRVEVVFHVGCCARPDRSAVPGHKTLQPPGRRMTSTALWLLFGRGRPLRVVLPSLQSNQCETMQFKSGCMVYHVHAWQRQWSNDHSCNRMSCNRLRPRQGMHDFWRWWKQIRSWGRSACRQHTLTASSVRHQLPRGRLCSHLRVCCRLSRHGTLVCACASNSRTWAGTLARGS